MTIPAYVASGVGAANAAAININWPAGHLVDDLGVMWIITANEPVPAPAGWTEFPNSPVGTGVAAAVGSIRLSVFWKWATSSGEAAVPIADAGNYQAGRILAVRGVSKTGLPYDITAALAQAGADNTVEIPGGVTTAAEALVLLFAAHATDTASAEFSGAANPDLANLTQRSNTSVTTGVGGGYFVVTGEKAVAGAFAQTTAALVTASAQARFMVALRAAAPPAALVVFQPTGLRLNLAIPEGLEGFDYTTDLTDEGVRLAMAVGNPVIQILGSTSGQSDPSFTAESVIEAARDRHASFDKSRHPSIILLRFLDRVQREMLAKAIARNMSFMAATAEIALPLADFYAGVALPFTYHLIHGGDALLDDGATGEFSLVPYGQRNAPIPFYAGWVSGDRLYLRDSPGDWLGVTKIVLSYVPTLGKLSSLRSVLALPRSAESTMVEACAAFMAGRGHTDPQIPALDESAFIRSAVAAEEAWLTEIGNRRRTQVKRIREVW